MFDSRVSEAATKPCSTKYVYFKRFFKNIYNRVRVLVKLLYVYSSTKDELPRKDFQRFCQNFKYRKLEENLFGRTPLDDYF